jgi:hypothetical protein
MRSFSRSPHIVVFSRCASRPFPARWGIAAGSGPSGARAVFHRGGSATSFKKLSRGSPLRGTRCTRVPSRGPLTAPRRPSRRTPAAIATYALNDANPRFHNLSTVRCGESLLIVLAFDEDLLGSYLHSWLGEASRAETCSTERIFEIPIERETRRRALARRPGQPGGKAGAKRSTKGLRSRAVSCPAQCAGIARETSIGRRQVASRRCRQPPKELRALVARPPRVRVGLRKVHPDDAVRRGWRVGRMETAARTSVRAPRTRRKRFPRGSSQPGDTTGLRARRVTEVAAMGNSERSVRPHVQSLGPGRSAPKGSPHRKVRQPRWTPGRGN